MNSHLVILKKPYLDLILAGEKTIELRLTRAKRPACGQVRPVTGSSSSPAAAPQGNCMFAWETWPSDEDGAWYAPYGPRPDPACRVRTTHRSVIKCPCSDAIALGGPVCGLARAKDVEYHEGLTPARIRQIQQQYNDQIRGDDAVWESLMDRQSGFLVWLSDVRRIDPIRIAKQDWRAWVVLTREKDFGLLRGLDSEGNP